MAFSGDEGNDTLLVDTGDPGAGAHGNVLDGGPGDDVLTGSQQRDVLSGGAGADRLNGSRGNDVIVGGPGFDLLWGDFGNDVLRTRDGERDSVTCGPGRDRTRSDRHDLTPNLREDAACDGSDIVRPAVLLAFTDGQPDARGRIAVKLRLIKPRCSGTIRLLEVRQYVGDRRYRFPTSARTRFRTRGLTRTTVVHVRLSRPQRRLLSRFEFDEFDFSFEIRDALGRRSRQVDGT